MSSWYVSLWSFFSINNLGAFLADRNKRIAANRASTIALQRYYPDAYVKWKISRSGLYMEVNRGGNRYAHISFHYGASRAGSLSHIIIDRFQDNRQPDSRRDIKIRYTNGTMRVAINYSTNTATLSYNILRRNNPIYDNIMDAVEAGLNVMANDSIRRLIGGENDIFTIQVINIPLDKLLYHLLCIDLFIKLNVLSTEVKENINLDFKTMFDSEYNQSFLINTNKTTDNLKQYFDIYQKDLIHALKENNEIVLEYLTSQHTTYKDDKDNSDDYLAGKKESAELEKFFNESFDALEKNTPTPTPTSTTPTTKAITTPTSAILTNPENAVIKSKYKINYL